MIPKILSLLFVCNFQTLTSSNQNNKLFSHRILQSKYQTPTQRFASNDRLIQNPFKNSETPNLNPLILTRDCGF